VLQNWLRGDERRALIEPAGDETARRWKSNECTHRGSDADPAHLGEKRGCK
jgi:hypothetical protein